MKPAIKKISAIEILDSRGDPTIEATVELDDGKKASASVPAGASTGAFEAFELRDGDAARYNGRGVLKAVGFVNGEINERLRGIAVANQELIDTSLIALDGTKTKSRIGANSILAVSLAAARAGALAAGLPLYRYIRTLTPDQNRTFSLPVPLVNVVNGGKHASTNLDLQEFWIIPHRRESFIERVRQGSEIFQHLGSLLRSLKMDTDLGDEGGYAPDFKNHEQVFGLLVQAIERAGFAPGSDVAIGFDAGSSVFFDQAKGTYTLSLEQKSFTPQEFIAFYMALLDKYPLRAIEDPLAEEDWESWAALTRAVKQKNADIRLIGDDIFVTNVERLQRGVAGGIANSIIIKLNQIGTLTETLACISTAQKAGYDVVISHRSGETSDAFIADLAVAVNAPYIKAGSTARGERTAKYNRLLEIEFELHG